MADYIAWTAGVLVLLLLIGFGLLLLFGPRFDIGVPPTEAQTAATTAYSKNLSIATAAPLDYYETTLGKTCTYYEDSNYIWPRSGTVISAPACLAENHYVTSTITRKCIDEGCTKQDGSPMAIGDTEDRVIDGCATAVAPCQRVALIAIYVTADGSASWWSMVTSAKSINGDQLGFGQPQTPEYDWYALTSGGNRIFYNVDEIDPNQRFVTRLVVDGKDNLNVGGTVYTWVYPQGDQGPAVVKSATIDRFMKFTFANSLDASLTSYPLVTDQLVIVSEEGFRNFVLDFGSNFGTSGSKIMKTSYLSAESDNTPSSGLDRTIDTTLNTPPPVSST